MGQDIMGEGCHKKDLDHANLIEDAKFYQDAALNYQNAYEVLYVQHVELQSKYSVQSYLIKEASFAIKAAKAESQLQHQELIDARCDCKVEIKSAIGRAVEQYKVQLSTAQSSLQAWDCEHQLTIQKLQDKIQSLEVSLASQVNLPSMGTTQPHDGTGLCNEVFNFMPGMVKKQRGMA